ncbi:MAG: universal stress protein [Candidatus Brocadiia bacterium]
MEEIRFDKIVCAVDFSKYSDHALRYALSLARLFGAELTVVHVVEMPFLPSYSMAGVPDLSMPVEELEENAREHLNEKLEQCRSEHADVEAEVLTGSPFVEIIDFARQVEADLIVMGTHGRSGLRQLLIGSVAEKVVRKAPCPVLTVKHPDHDFEMP